MRDRSAPLSAADVETLDWAKMGGLLPAIVQDATTRQVLMLGYMNREALAATLAERCVTFYSRSKGRLWRKGETSGHSLDVRSVQADCDGDALLILAEPLGPTCHLGTASCFSTESAPGIGWLGELSRIVGSRVTADPATSYTAKLLDEGPVRIAQKVGEEGVELALAAATGQREACIDEAADLMFHVTVLMQARGFGWDEVTGKLRERHGPAASPAS
jgi:phosphoribosyl-ATP pyrophosphohydrolase/phosphoribosyl-AMP cyclohydrolase